MVSENTRDLIRDLPRQVRRDSIADLHVLLGPTAMERRSCPERSVAGPLHELSDFGIDAGPGE